MAKQKVFVTRPDFPGNGVKYLQKRYDVELNPLPQKISKEKLMEGIKGKDALFCISTDKIDTDVLDASGPNLKVIATFSLGFEHIDIEECKKRNIRVCNSPNPVSVACVAEFTVGLLLALSRKIAAASSAIKQGEWSESWTPTWYVGRGLLNAEVGVVGMGRIGQAVLKRLLGFEVKTVFYYDVVGQISQAEEHGARYLPFEELLRKSDYVVVTCNLTEQSKGLFDQKAFSTMKSTAYFINTSRGGIVDQEALYEALKSNQIKGAALDVMYPEPLPKDHKLTTLPNVLLVPHIAAAEETALLRLSSLAAENIHAVLEGEEPPTPVF